MAHSSRPASRRRSNRAGTAMQTEIRQKDAVRSAQRPASAKLLPRIIWLIMTLAILVGIIALVHATSISAPSTSTTDREHQAPPFTLPTLAGTTFDLAAQIGHPVALYFMGPCASSLQGSRDVAQALQSAKTRGAVALVIDANQVDRPADLSTFVKETGIPASVPIHWSIDTTGAIVSAYQVQTLETTVVLDTKGYVASRSAGSLPPEQLAQIVRNLA